MNPGTDDSRARIEARDMPAQTRIVWPNLRIEREPSILIKWGILEGYDKRFVRIFPSRESEMKISVPTLRDGATWHNRK
jgi:hypothetical protein